MTREEAIDIINSCVQADTEDVNEALDMAIKALEQETKRGKWLTSNIGEGEVYCSFCHVDSLFDIKTNYCPNCGIKMEVEE